MPPILALMLTVGFVAALFLRHWKANSSGSAALWIPLVWLLITGSRFVTQWIAVLTDGSMGVSNAALEDGSPTDRLIFLLLILAGLNVLRRRRVRVWTIVSNNACLTIFLGYCLLAVLWSDFPFVAFKRWIKVLGHPVMALVVITDTNPIQAVRTLLKRAAFVLVPFSILLIKYFPEAGRGFDYWSGEAVNIGTSLSKNELGYVCMLFGMFFFWNILTARQIENGKARREDLALSVVFLVMIWWLLSSADSATSFACGMIGTATMVVLGFRWINKRYIGWYAACLIVGLMVAEPAFGLSTQVLDALGRDATLTDRTAVWGDVFELTTNPVLGAGFESFWLGERIDTLYAKWWWRPTQAHNGYVETYINLGWVGVTLLVVLLLATFRRIRVELLNNFEFGRFRMGLLVAIVVYNVTEATFTSIHPLWTMFYLIALSYPMQNAASSTLALGVARPGERQRILALSQDRRIAAYQPQPALPRVTGERRPYRFLDNRRGKRRGHHGK